ncbi:MAG TPA: TIGR04282 family arsenosugar biosynthesis glycosyltransferase [Ideonella sp.]|nr:TIGR04282 family arsenosugar biosynthesis glycosyltransferase [Ideonella sp.]
MFARAPIAGAAKTRLAGRLGPERAARLHERLARAALRTAAAAGCGRVELHASPGHALFDALGVTVRLQRGGDLGERMHRALRNALRRHRIAILIGADCPALRPQDLRRAARWLRGGTDVVLAPAEDGGYALIGARRLSPALFRGVAWGSAQVLERTLRNAATAGLRLRLLRSVWDVDRPEDLERLRSLRLPSTPRRAARR